jgi:hypothetical protein
LIILDLWILRIFNNIYWLTIFFCIFVKKYNEK